jgi:predicted small metal-binding protein
VRECGEIKQRWMIGEENREEHVLRELVEHYEAEPQMTKAIEECGELIHEAHVNITKGPQQSS